MPSLLNLLLTGAAAGLISPVEAPPQPPEANAAPPAPSCADRPRLEAERVAARRAIADYVLSGSDRRQRQRTASAGKTAAQAALGLFLPFGVGMAVGGGVALVEAADKHAKAKAPAKPAPPQPDVDAMIARQQRIEADLALLDREGCPPSTPPGSAAASRR